MAVFITGGQAAERVNYIEYLQTTPTGKQYFDTGFKPNNNTRIVMDAEYRTDNTALVFYFSARTAWTNTAFCLRLSNSRTTWMSEYANTYAYHTVDSMQRLTIDWNKNTVKIGSVAHTYSAATFQCNYNLVLFALNSGNAISDFAQNLRLYSCQIYDSDNLVRDYWPCYDPGGVACLYDKVEKKYYYNAGTGEFIAGGAA